MQNSRFQTFFEEALGKTVAVLYLNFVFREKIYIFFQFSLKTGTKVESVQPKEPIWLSLVDATHCVHLVR